MSIPAVLTADYNLSTFWWLNRYARLTGLEYEITYPGGDSVMTATISLPYNYEPVGLKQGRRVALMVGTRPVWTGTLDEPQRGDDQWTITATGAAADAKRFRAIAANTLNLQNVVDGAITRGLQWRRRGTLPTYSGSTQASNAVMLDEALANVMQATNGYWRVRAAQDWVQEIVWDSALPTTPAYVLRLDAVPPGRSLDAYATTVYVLYLNSGAGGAQAVVSATSPIEASATNPGGVPRVEQLADVTGLGAMTTASATSAAAALLARTTYSYTFTGDLTILPGELRVLNGGVIDYATFRPGGLIKVDLVDPAAIGTTAAMSGAQYVMAGATKYDAIADVLTVTPLAAARTDLTSVLSTTPDASIATFAA